uniref:DUF148 domain-containing protein n=1 Tax=Heterorhabditis bacteriophora TaxID=37862 RepID=A0A1I7X076_HETBA
MYSLIILLAATLILDSTASPVQPSQQTMTISMLQEQRKVEVTAEQELLMQILDGLSEQKETLKILNTELQKLSSKKNLSQSMNENMLPVEFVNHLLNILTGSGSASNIYPTYFVAPIDKSGSFPLPIAQSSIYCYIDRILSSIVKPLLFSDRIRV